MSAVIALKHTPARQVIYRTRGRTHGQITRLMSPGDLGELLKPSSSSTSSITKAIAFPTLACIPTRDWPP